MGIEVLLARGETGSRVFCVVGNPAPDVGPFPRQVTAPTTVRAETPEVLKTEKRLRTTVTELEQTHREPEGRN
ncbi:MULTISPECIES: hypothetical protein [unclassified Streptomyces]|uniref:hypothetical protein n=1 Tax=unclassified Streptomyces TaxID=2593676 RepID=UPI001319D5D2|nr:MULTISPECIES: hypothetical protein [unclassified Streptomyces]MYT29286.1 hypothetical protein [Streptomyces sp. SID8354]